MPRAFFFPHALGDGKPWRVRKNDTPQRVPFSVTGTFISTTDKTDGTAIVFGDGYWKTNHLPAAGSNQDPCLFSAPIGIFHSFCRVDSPRGADNYVATLEGQARHLLPNIVEKNDLIFYGKPHVNEQRLLSIGVDAVLVVAECIPFAELKERVGGADAYGYNLIDGETGGTHEASAKRPPVIVGATIPTPDAVAALATSFVPLALKGPDGKPQLCRLREKDIGAECWGALDEVCRLEMFSAPEMVRNKGRICEVPRAAGEALARAVMKGSGTATPLAGYVAVPPLRPPPRLKRLDPRTAEIVVHDDYVAKYGRRA